MIMENVELAHEMMVVGGMITNPDRCIDFALANLGSESFADTDLGLVFDMVSKRYRDKQSVQPDSLLVDLARQSATMPAACLLILLDRRWGLIIGTSPTTCPGSRIQTTCVSLKH